MPVLPSYRNQSTDMQILTISFFSEKEKSPNKAVDIIFGYQHYNDGHK